MKAKQVVVVVALLLSVCFGGLYLKFFSTFNTSIKVYVCQVGIYKDDANANAMIEKLKAASLNGYSYKKEETTIVISDIFLDENKANELGKKISEQQMTCVIKSYNVSKECKDSIEKQNYEIVLQELAS